MRCNVCRISLKSWKSGAPKSPDSIEPIESGDHAKCNKHTRSPIKTTSPPHTVKHQDILSWPVGTLEVPSLIENTLIQLKITTLDDLLRLDLDEVSDMRGVGVSKVKAISELKAAALKLIEGDASPPHEKTYILDELIAAGIDPDTPWQEILTRIDQRARTVFERENFESLRDVVLRHESNTLIQLNGFGESSQQRLGEQIDALIRLGLDGFMYGEDGRPQSLIAARDRCMGLLQDTDASIFKRRYHDQETLESIASDFGITREGIRQRIERGLDAMRQRYGSLIESLLGEALDECTRRGGLMPLSVVATMLHCDEDDVEPQLRLCFDIIKQSYAILGPCLSLLESNELQQFIDHMAEYVESCPEPIIPAKDLIEHAVRRDLRIEPYPLLNVLSKQWQTEIQDDGLINPWLDTPSQYAALLRDVEGPMHIEQIREHIAKLYNTSELPTERHVYLQIQRSPDVFYIDRGTYIHRAQLPVPFEQLEEAAQWAIDQIRETEHAVSASIFIEPLMALGLINEHVTSLLLRDVMGQFEEIKTFQSTDFVAHLESFQGYRKTQEDHVEEILLSTPKPLTCDEVCALYPDYLTHSRAAVYATLSQASFALNLGQGRFIHTQQIGLTQVAQDQVLEHAIAHLLEIQHPISATALLDAIGTSPAAAYLKVHPQGHSILWALLKGASEVICGKGELIVLADESTDVRDPLISAILHILEEQVVLTPAQIRREIIFRHGYLANHGPIYDAIDRTIDSGHIEVFLKDWRVCRDVDPEHIYAAFIHPNTGQRFPTEWDGFNADDLDELEALFTWANTATSRRLLTKLQSFRLQEEEDDV